MYSYLLRASLPTFSDRLIFLLIDVTTSRQNYHYDHEVVLPALFSFSNRMWRSLNRTLVSVIRDNRATRCFVLLCGLWTDQ